MTYRKTECWVCKGRGLGYNGDERCLRCDGKGWLFEHYAHRTVGQWLGDLYVAIINFLNHIDTED